MRRIFSPCRVIFALLDGSDDGDISVTEPHAQLGKLLLNILPLYGSLWAFKSKCQVFGLS